MREPACAVGRGVCWGRLGDSRHAVVCAPWYVWLRRSRQRRWREWLAEAKATISSRPHPTVEVLAALRDAGLALPLLNVFASGGGGAALAQDVHKVSHDIGARIYDALHWRAEVRDALSCTVRKLPLEDLEHLHVEGSNRINVGRAGSG